MASGDDNKPDTNSRFSQPHRYGAAGLCSKSIVHVAVHDFANIKWRKPFSLLLFAEPNGHLWLGTQAAAACAVIGYDGSRLLSADEMILIKMLHAGASHWPGRAAFTGAAGAAGAKEGPLRYEFVLAAHPLKEGSKTGTSPLSMSARLWQQHFASSSSGLRRTHQQQNGDLQAARTEGRPAKPQALSPEPLNRRPAPHALAVLAHRPSFWSF
ncbi:LOW QUALITY PROTEIN: hypothetical protein MKX08_006694 [Trichoderma sp. CBMAI-0020]|nr:LOW QUALITY PROTEIN: hypothetical protein MKX08_006694 [Trichoderma sp. CBMAI-0020]